MGRDRTVVVVSSPYTHGLVGDGECVIPQRDRGYGGNGQLR